MTAADAIVDALLEAEVQQWNGKNVVWTNGDYFVAVDDPNDARYVTVWTSDNHKIGWLSTRTHPVSGSLKDYLGVANVDVAKSYRGNGLATQMYRALMRCMQPKWKGISSYLPDQANKKQVPRIWKRLGGQPSSVSADYLQADRKHVVEALLEADDFDPKEFAMSPSVLYRHPVWDVTPQAIRDFFRAKGFQVRQVRRRTRGALVVMLRKNPPPTDYKEIEALEWETRRWLEQVTGKGPNHTPFEVRVVWLHDDVSSVEIEIYKMEHGNTKRYGEGPHPYA